jgi:hypothetical protein
VTPNTGIDTAINNAASRMTNAKPSDALRASVMSRIAVDRPSRFSWRLVLVGSAAASVALVVLSVFVLRNTNGHVSPKLSTPSVATVAATAKADPTAATTPTSPLTSVARTIAADDSGRFVVTADADQTGMSVAALEHPEQLTPVKPLSETAPVKAIDIEPIRVAPLVVLAIGDDNQ